MTNLQLGTHAPALWFRGNGLPSELSPHRWPRPGYDKMQFDIVPASALTQTDLSQWRAIQESNPALSNPFFSNEFTLAVDTVRPDVHVAIMRQGGEVVGFFPFERGAFGVGQPVGGALSDYQGVIAPVGVHWNPVEMVRACGLRAWDFDHLISAQTEFAPYHRVQTRSMIIDLSRGYAAYAADLRAAGSTIIKELEYENRRLVRHHGPVTFVPHTGAAAALETLAEWKSSQYRTTGVRDLFATPWIGELVRRIHSINTPDFVGFLSVLEVSGRPVAAVFGMRSKLICYPWFPAYDPEFATYSPGLLLYHRMAQHGEAIGVKQIDFGKGGQQYKQRLTNGEVAICEGSVECSMPLTVIRRVRSSTARLIRKTPLRRPARFVKRQIQQLRARLT